MRNKFRISGIFCAILLSACGARTPSVEDIQTAIAETLMAEVQMTEETDEPLVDTQPTEVQQKDSEQDVGGMPSVNVGSTTESIVTGNQDECDVGN